MGKLLNGSSPHVRSIPTDYLPLVSQAMLNLFEESSPEGIIGLRRQILAQRVPINRAYDEWLKSIGVPPG